jgi:hypothetical protein
VRRGASTGMAVWCYARGGGGSVSDGSPNRTDDDGPVAEGVAPGNERAPSARREASPAAVNADEFPPPPERRRALRAVSPPAGSDRPPLASTAHPRRARPPRRPGVHVVREFSAGLQEGVDASPRGPRGHPRDARHLAWAMTCPRRAQSSGWRQTAGERCTRRRLVRLLERGQGPGSDTPDHDVG